MTDDIVASNLPEIIPNDKKELVRRMYAKGVTNDEWEVYLELAKRYQLDPFMRQIWCMKFGNKDAIIFAGRDGFVKIAHQTGLFDGIKSEVSCDENGKPVSATAWVWRKGCSHTFEDTVEFEEYYRAGKTGEGLWDTKPKTMIRKVAEVHALRKAFCISGLYAPEEFGYEEERSKIQPRSDDITVKPVETRTEPLNLISEETCKIIRENYEFQGFSKDVFANARQSSGYYDRDIIDADFAVQMAKKNAVKQAKPATEVKTCHTCGVAIADKDMEASKKAGLHFNYCPVCLKVEVASMEPKDSAGKVKLHGTSMEPENSAGKIILTMEPEKSGGKVNLNETSMEPQESGGKTNFHVEPKDSAGKSNLNETSMEPAKSGGEKILTMEPKDSGGGKILSMEPKDSGGKVNLNGTSMEPEATAGKRILKESVKCEGSAKKGVEKQTNPEVAPAAPVYKCEECGAEVTEPQKKVSQFFSSGKILCHDCLQNSTKTK